MTDFFYGLLRGESVAWPAISEGEAIELFEAAEREGVHLLLADRLNQQPDMAGWPGALRTRLLAALQYEVAIGQVTRRELCHVVAALDAEGVRPLLFKGAALALTHYPLPALRPHVDVDLLVSQEAVGAASSVFERLGYARPPYVTGELVSSQVPYVKSDRYGVQHTFDLHWKISIPQVFANLFSMDELTASSVPLVPLGDARAIGPVHALAVACIHRVAHHHHNDRLIWVYDIHLLAGGLSAAEAEAFVGLAGRKGISAVCERGLAVAQQKFLTTLPAGLMEELRTLAAGQARDRSTVYLRRDLSKFDVLLSDLAALESWRQRGRMLREHVFPPETYMQRVYGISSRAVLPVAYAWRILAGARRWFRRGTARN